MLKKKSTKILIEKGIKHIEKFYKKGFLQQKLYKISFKTL